MRIIFFIGIFYNFYMFSFSVIDAKNQSYNINVTGYNNLTVSQAKDMLISRFYPNINIKNLVAYIGDKKLGNDDHITSNTVFKEVTKKIVIDDYIRILAELLDKDRAVLERVLINKIHNLKNIKSEKIALIEAINNQDKDFKEFLGAELQKLIKNKESISEWQNYIKLAKNKEKDILKAIIDHVMQ